MHYDYLVIYFKIISLNFFPQIQFFCNFTKFLEFFHQHHQFFPKNKYFKKSRKYNLTPVHNFHLCNLKYFSILVIKSKPYQTKYFDLNHLKTLYYYKVYSLNLETFLILNIYLTEDFNLTLKKINNK